jgi:hypothetical protein
VASSTLLVVLGIVGSVASVIGVLISAPGVKSKVIHIVYALFLTAIAASAVGYYNRMSAARKEIDEINRIEREAKAILDSSDRSTEGSMAGLMLAGLSFLEKYKARLPETYARAIKVCEASGLYAGRSEDNSLKHFYNIQEGSSAMYYLLVGVAAAITAAR